MRWKTIFFDLDNTLFSHEDAFERAIKYCFKRYNHRWNQKILEQQWYSVFKKNCDLYWSLFEEKKLSAKDYRRLRYKATLDEFSIPFSEQEADEFHHLYYEVVDDFSKPFPVLNHLLSELKAAEIMIGIITNGTIDTQYNKIDKLGITQFIDKKHIIISEEVHASKPNRKIFDVAKENIHLNDNRAPLFVGDSWEHDVVGSIEAGWEAIFLNTRNELPTSNHKPVAHCNNLTEVATIIFNENDLKG